MIPYHDWDDDGIHVIVCPQVALPRPPNPDLRLVSPFPRVRPKGLERDAALCAARAADRRRIDNRRQSLIFERRDRRCPHWPGIPPELADSLRSAPVSPDRLQSDATGGGSPSEVTDG